MNRLTLRETGDIRIVGKASTISRQLRELAALADPRQDIDPSAPYYVRGLSREKACG